MKRDAFASFHPLVNFLYFAAVIGFVMFFMHPACLVISMVNALAYSLYLNGKKAVRVGLFYLLPMLIFTALLNPLFNHRGATILAYLPSGNPLTLESILYGIAAAVMLVTVIAWFSCFNAVITSDKFIYLFGRVAPALSLILSMSLRLVPRFKSQITVISDAQRGIGRDVFSGSLYQRAKHGIKILSILVTWALENAVETASSMKSRGYGLPGRTAFLIFRFERRDALALGFIVACTVVVFAGAVSGAFQFRYFPTITGNINWLYKITYLALGAFPIILNIREDIIWRRIEPTS